MNLPQLKVISPPQWQHHRHVAKHCKWVRFNVPLDTLWVISENSVVTTAVERVQRRFGEDYTRF